jgi:predicted metalloendopeptidase
MGISRLREVAAILGVWVALGGCGSDRANMSMPSPPPSGSTGPIDAMALDRTANPCQDFFQFACGGYVMQHPPPMARRSDPPRAFAQAMGRNYRELRDLLEHPAPGDGDMMKLATYYSTCLDTSKDAASLATLKQELAQIDAVTDVHGLARAIAAVQLDGADAIFKVAVDKDLQDPSRLMMSIDQGGLGISNREFYVNQIYEGARRSYLTVIEKAFMGVGATHDEAIAQADRVLGVEVALAQASTPAQNRGGPETLYHRTAFASFVQTAAAFPWADYLAAVGAPTMDSLNVLAPDFFSAFGEMIGKLALDDLKLYLRWRLIQPALPAVNSTFAAANSMMSKVMATQGQPSTDRIGYCLLSTQRVYTDLLDRAYVKHSFDPGSRVMGESILKGVEQAFEQNLDAVTWIDGKTREEARGKLHKVRDKLGYPDMWRIDMSPAPGTTSHLANLYAGQRAGDRRELGRIGQLDDDSDWHSPLATVNAFYHVVANEMIFPAGILQAPFFNVAAPLPVNYGAIGAAMGHELTHGFDNHGRLFDGTGKLRDWWTMDSKVAFGVQTECVQQQYNQFQVAGGQSHVDGVRTLAENIADMGGLKSAYRAYKTAAGGKSSPQVLDFNSDQQFFLAFAQIWCQSLSSRAEINWVASDVHSPPRARVNGALTNTPAFADAWKCAPGTPMAPAKPCSVW